MKRGEKGRKGLDGVRGSGESQRLTVRLTAEQLQTLDDIVASGAAANRGAALRWLIQRSNARGA